MADNADKRPDPRRLTAWVAISRLFLDTELDEQDLDTIARDLRATGYSAHELQRIYEEEVAPVCWRNLCVLPGGVWTGFDRDWLAHAIEKHIRRPGLLHAIPILRQWRMVYQTRMTRAEWNEVKARL